MLASSTGMPALDFLVELSGRYPTKPLYVASTGDRQHMDAAKEYLEPRGVPTFPLIEDPFEVLDIAYACGQALAREPAAAASSDS